MGVLGFYVGVILGLGWVLMQVYDWVARSAHLPQMPFWIAVGVVFIFGYVVESVKGKKK